jgi:hypothetical protein
MAIRRPGYRSLDDLLAHEPIAEEDPPTADIIKRLEHVRSVGKLSRGEFLDICRWKSPRAMGRCRRNSTISIEEVSRRVFGTRNEREKLELLTRLQGVRVPTASAILTLTDPKRYGVIDIRVWQLLHVLGSVSNNPRGRGFTFDHWHRYLQILRHHAQRLRVPVRRVELTLFRVHESRQVGRLYM